MKKEIRLLKLSLVRFKGAKDLEINFEQQTNIYGDNGTFKTTIFDAFSWLLFDKDSRGRSDFKIKTQDEFGKTIPKLEHEVQGVFDVSGEKITIRRVLKEKWSKKKGSSGVVFKGNVTELYWNDVPVQLKDYKAKINQIIDENLFRTLTDPLYFSSSNWKDQQKKLTELVDYDSDFEVLEKIKTKENVINVKELKDAFDQGKSAEDYKKQVLASIKKAKAEIKEITPRIDELNRQKPENQDFEELENQLKEEQKTVETLDELITNSSKAFDEKLKKQRDIKVKLSNVISEISNSELAAKNAADDMNKNPYKGLKTIKDDIANIKANIRHLEQKIQFSNSKVNDFSEQIIESQENLSRAKEAYLREHGKTMHIDNENYRCPTCKRELEDEDKEAERQKLTSQFNSNKANQLERLVKSGKSIKEDISNYSDLLKKEKEVLESLKTKKDDFETKITNLELDLKNETAKVDNTAKVEPFEFLNKDENYKLLISKKEQLEGSIVDYPSIDNSEFIDKKTESNKVIEDLKLKLLDKKTIISIEKRELELLEQEKELSSQIANVEHSLFVVDQYKRLKIKSLENNINKLFKTLKFRMFEEQVNGGVAECCHALINGVPFSDANSAAKINAGIEIINILSNNYGINAPIFIDNKESVTKLQETESQLVNLIVSEKDKKIRIN